MTEVRNLTRDAVLANCVRVAGSPLSQFLGLMGRAGLPPGSGLILPRTRGVHTHFMRFTIDVIFYDSQRVVVGLAEGLRPWRLSHYYLSATGVVELPVGTIRGSGTMRGDVLDIVDDA